jgi:hypothetical protein
VALNTTVFTITKIDANSYSLQGINTSGYTLAYVPATDPGKVTAGTQLWREGAFSTYQGWPAAVIFHEQRLMFFKDDYLFASKTGDPNDFGTGTAAIPLATDGFSYEIASDKVNVVRWGYSLSNLMLGSTGGIWRAGAQSANDPITATNAKINQQNKKGSAMLCCQGIDNSILYVERLGLPLNLGSRVVELTYSWQNDAYVGKDLSLLAEHISRGGIVDWAFQQAPFPILWSVRNDGVPLGLTYEKDQDVYGWHRHPTDGEAESVACIPGDVQDDLWMVVRRDVGGVKRYIEYLKPWDWGDDQEDCFFVDCGLTYTGAATATITGLGHLEGKTVAILANGAVHRQLVVSGSQVTLDKSATKVHIGLPFTSTLETLDLEGGGAEGPAQGKRRRVSKALVRLYQTGSGFWIGREGRMDLVDFRTSTDRMGYPPELLTGIRPVEFPGSWSREARVKIIMDQPLPCTVLSIIPTLKTEDA